MSFINIITFYQNIIDYYNIPIVYWITIWLILLTKSWILLIVFVIGFLINKKINIWLKNYFKQPLPDKETETETEEYGMPSAHSQEIWFTFIFVFYTFSNTYIKILYGLLALYVSYKCLKYHTNMQILVGAMVGIMISSGIVKILNKFISKTPMKT